jgi:acyl carrier protein phosphodiesterase
MSVLSDHRQRVAALGQTLDRLERMHEEAYRLWDRIVTLAASGMEHRREQLDALHDEAYALGDRIARLREETFGEISIDSQLLLTAQVESVPTSVLYPERTPVPGE